MYIVETYKRKRTELVQKTRSLDVDLSADAQQAEAVNAWPYILGSLVHQRE